jgi:uncharacterized membrane protein YGL010W
LWKNITLMRTIHLILMKSLAAWLEEYGESHRNATNITIHWICVPVIFWCVSGLLFQITIPVLGNLAIPVLALATIYYATLSRFLWPGMLLFGFICLLSAYQLFILLNTDSVFVYLGLFTAAWIGQFYGHHVEGKKPSFLKDLQFLMIGPAWLMVKLYRKIGIQL